MPVWKSWGASNYPTLWTPSLIRASWNKYTEFCSQGTQTHKKNSIFIKRLKYALPKSGTWMQFTSDSSLLFKSSFKGNPVSPVSEHLLNTHCVKSSFWWLFGLLNSCWWWRLDRYEMTVPKKSLADWWTYVEHIRIIMTKIKPKQCSHRNNYYISIINMRYACTNYLISIVKNVYISST